MQRFGPSPIALWMNRRIFFGDGYPTKKNICVHKRTKTIIEHETFLNYMQWKFIDLACRRYTWTTRNEIQIRNIVLRPKLKTRLADFAVVQCSCLNETCTYSSGNQVLLNTRENLKSVILQLLKLYTRLYCNLEMLHRNQVERIASLIVRLQNDKRREYAYWKRYLFVMQICNVFG